MHICYLTGEYPPMSHGGIGSFVQTLAKELVKLGHTVSVIGVYKQPSLTLENDCGVQVIRVPWCRIPKIGVLINHLRLNQQIKNLHRNTPIDLVEGQENAFTFLPGRKPWKKVIRMHGGHQFFSSELGTKYSKYKCWAEKRSFAIADFYCAVSNYVKDSTLKLLQKNISVEVIPNPIDTALFCPEPEIPVEEGLLVFVGTLCEKKGIRQLILAMPQIVNAVENAHLWVIGRDSVDPATGRSYKQTLLDNIKSEVANKILFIGSKNRDQIPDLLARAVICVYPSHMEAQGIVVLEGMASGKPVITSKYGPGPETIQHGFSGLLCDPFKPESIADEVVKLLLDSKLRSKLGQNARDIVISKFSLELLLQKNMSFYQSCLD